MMDLYIYLNECNHVTTWINGGTIPIHPAKRYFARERKGTQTPDENYIKVIRGVGKAANIDRFVKVEGRGTLIMKSKHWIQDGVIVATDVDLKITSQEAV